MRTRVAGCIVTVALLALTVALARPDDPPPDDSKPKEDSTRDTKAPAPPAPVPRTSPPPPAPSPKAPARKPSAAAGSEARPAGTPAPGETAARPQEPPLRFTDEDLERYRPSVRADEEVVEEAGSPASLPAPGSAPAPAARPVTGPAAAGRPAPGAPPSGKPGAAPAAGGQVKTSGPVTLGPSPQVKRPPKKKAPPPPDPLAPFKQREAHEKYRAGQIEGLRGKIADLESRLEYLKAKRIAITDPLNLMPRAQSQDDEQADASLKPEALLLQVEAEIAGTERQLEETRTALAEIQMRFGAEAGIR